MNKESVVIFADKAFHGFYESLSIKGEIIGMYSFEQAGSHLQELDADLFLIDCGINHVQGLLLLKRTKRSHADVPVLFLAAGGSEELAVKAFRAGGKRLPPKACGYFRTKINN